MQTPTTQGNIMLDNQEFKDFLKQSKVTLLYITKSGSQLYGTNTPESDVDYKGIFIADKDSILLKQDPEHFTYTSGQKDSKNTAQDIDITLDSVHKWNKLLAKGETGAIDLLFSVFDLSSTIYINPEFERLVLNNYKQMVSRNMHAFIGYSIGMSKKYNIKGQRYRELKALNILVKKYKSQDMETHLFDKLRNDPEFRKFKYIKLITQKGTYNTTDTEYLEVLGKKYERTVKPSYLIDRLSTAESDFGNRAKAATANGVDWKGLSHAYRVILEVEELLQTCFIRFPLRHREQIKAVKAGEIDLEVIMNTINHKIYYVKELQKESTLPTKIDQAILNDFILHKLKD